MQISYADSNSENLVEFDVSEWQKILLGVALPSEASGFKATSAVSENLANTLFPMLWPQTPEMDLF